ncbi:hypothetical protein NUW54_g9739 [Trametes sanguinea]|uniref:Uncharacterized protein n=1 Tax=Trametes sanguinea TaxID=158606 RepID=A0ACC1P3W1_9APHY|nr:hypothetical protein NUW54_g9739 [Trametes sanguinea]
MAERGRSGFQQGGGDAPHKSPSAVFAFCAQESATSATCPGSREDTGQCPREDSRVRAQPRTMTSKTCEGLRRPPRPPAAVSGCPGAQRAVPSLGALAERGIDLRSLERQARKRLRALRAVAACFRIVSVCPAKLAKFLSEVFPLSHLSSSCEAKGGQPLRRLVEDAPRHRAPDMNLSTSPPLRVSATTGLDLQEALGLILPLL